MLFKTIRNRWLGAAAFTLFFALIYECFSHQVYSNWMLLAFLFPLLGGALPYALLARASRAAQPGVLSRCLYDSGLAALTVGSVFLGVLEIYGTTSRLSAVYWICGGALSLLYHRDCGPVVAVGMADYAVNEPFNQQQTTDTAAHRSPCPRIESECEGRRFAQHYDYGAQMTAKEERNALTVRVDAYLCDEDHRQKDVAGTCSLDYALTKQALTVKGRVSPALAGHAVYILPVISDRVVPDVTCGTLLPEPERGFCLNPGFAFTEYRVRPDRRGRFTVILAPAG